MADGALETIKAAVKRLNSLYVPKVSVRDLSAFTRQLATMSGAGVPLYQAMNTLWDSMEESRLKVIIGKIKDKIKGGTPFSECLAEYPETFPPLMIGLIKVGEVTGLFEKTLGKYADQLELEESCLFKVISHLLSNVPQIFVGIPILVGEVSGILDVTRSVTRV